MGRVQKVDLFRDELVRGTLSSGSIFRRFGHNDDCSTAFETVWHGSNLYTYLTTAEQLHISSDSASDDGDPVGAGARTLFVRGLDANYNYIEETVTLNGVTPVVTTGSFLRVHKAKVMSAGSTGYNSGSILLQNEAEDIDLGVVEVQTAETHGCIWTVPAGRTAFITSWRGSESSTKGGDVSLWMRTHSTGVWQYKRGVYILDNIFSFEFSMPLKVSAKTDIEVRTKAILSGAKVSAFFKGWYE